MRLKSGAEPEYRQRHEDPWPDLLTAIRAAGVLSFTIYGVGETLFVHSEVADPSAWPRAWATEVHSRWGATLADLMEVGSDGAPITTELEEIFHMEPS